MKWSLEVECKSSEEVDIFTYDTKEEAMTDFEWYKKNQPKYEVKIYSVCRTLLDLTGALDR